MHDPHQRLSTEQLREKPKNIHPHHGAAIAGLCSAVLTPQKGPTKHQTQHLKRFVMEHGFANSIIQTDGENAITELAQQAAQQPGPPTRQSPTYDHRSQGAVAQVPSDLVLPTEGNKVSMGISPTTRSSQPTSCFSTMASSTQRLCHQPLLAASGHPQRTSKGHWHLARQRPRNRSTSFRSSRSTS